MEHRCSQQIDKENFNMMKKMITLALAALMLVGMVACGGSGEEMGTSFGVDSATTLLEQVWGSYADDEKFAIMGGDYDTNVADAPAKFNHENAEYMDSMLAIPADAAAMVDDAASMIHMMNANTFTAGAFHLADLNNEEAFVSAVKDSVMNRQWLCGFPEKLVIVSDGSGYVVTAFGNGEAIETFKTKLTEMGGTVVTEENLM